MKRFPARLALVMFSLFMAWAHPAMADLSAMVGKPAPPMSLKTVDGADLSLGSLKGKGVILNFWATWCPPCKVEMPELEKTHRDGADDGIVVVGVNYQEGPETVKRYVEQTSLSLPIVLDTGGEVSRRYRVTALPTTFFIDRDGVVAGFFVGPLTAETLDEWESKLKGD
ncbi:MAG: TlpA family protein disulfide reductase [Candidatus Nitrospinota bacterium M3_3B_026]